MTFIQNLPLNLNIPSFGLGRTLPAKVQSPLFEPDEFITNPLENGFENAADILVAAESNPVIVKILNEHKLPLKINERALEDLKKGHLRNTRLIAAKVYSALPADLKSEVNLSRLQTAAMYHDYGKVLIPDRILNKNGNLTDSEWEIMKEHSKLGYELLKNKGFDKETLELIKYHHQKPDKSGYPAVDGHFDYDVSAQILAAADKYTALSEKRSYKPEMPKEQVLAEIEKDISKGIISQEVFNALKSVV